jgi:cell division protein FtsL
MQLEADREIDEYKQQLDTISHLKEMKRQRNKNLVNIAKVLVMLIVFIYITMSVL